MQVSLSIVLQNPNPSASIKSSYASSFIYQSANLLSNCAWQITSSMKGFQTSDMIDQDKSSIDKEARDEWEYQQWGLVDIPILSWQPSLQNKHCSPLPFLPLPRVQGWRRFILFVWVGVARGCFGRKQAPRVCMPPFEGDKLPYQRKLENKVVISTVT